MSLSHIEKGARLAYLKAIADDYARGVNVEQITAEHPALIARFSLRNVMLILAQCPHAIECAGFHEWRKAGRSVRKGAKGIAILVPMTRKNEDDEPAVRFSYRHVFDIADTDPVEVEQLATV